MICGRWVLNLQQDVQEYQRDGEPSVAVLRVHDALEAVSLVVLLDAVAVVPEVLLAVGAVVLELVDTGRAHAWLV